MPFNDSSLRAPPGNLQGACVRLAALGRIGRLDPNEYASRARCDQRGAIAVEV
jgi:hypothetical protein